VGWGGRIIEQGVRGIKQEIDTTMRGIVTGIEMGISAEGDVTIPVALPPLELRKCLLYWDQIAVANLAGSERGTRLLGNVTIRNLGPNTKADTKAIRQDIDELIAASILKEYTVTIDSNSLSPPTEDSQPLISMFGFRGSQINEAALASKAFLTQQLNNQSMYDSIWTVAHSGQKLILPPGIGEPVDNLVVDLLDRLPVPYEDVPIADILAFRDKRRPELLEFRAGINNLARAITNSPDKRQGIISAFEELERALLAIDRLLGENAIKRALSGLAVFLRTGRSQALDILSATGLALGVQQGTAKSILLGAAAGVAGIALNTALSVVKSPCLQLPQDCRDFAYLYHAKKRWR